MAIIDVATFGATGAGGDDTIAIQAAIAAAKPGDRITFGPGRFGISQTLFPPCYIEGADPIHSNLFVVPGSNLPTMINISDKSGIGVRNIGMTGDGVYIPNSQGAAIMLGGQSVAVDDIRIEGCRFDNFKADYWILGNAATAVDGLKICHNRFMTKLGDGPVYADLSPNGGGLVVLYGSGTAVMMNTKVNDNIIEGGGVAFGIIFYGGHRYFEVSRNIILNMGAATTPGQFTHAILVYGLQDHNGGEPAIGTINNNQIHYPANGIYCASADQVLIATNKVTGQSHSDNGTLPRGGIILLGTNGAVAVGNDLYNCWCGIAVAGSAATSVGLDMMIVSNRIRSAAGGYTIGMQLNCELPTNGRLSIMDNDIFLLAGGSKAFVNQIRGTGDVVIKNNASRSSIHGIADASAGRTFIGGNTFFPI